ncbi:hypothetical protein Cpir12675_002708 [Ceratocystis pirilliformis]|uniref:Macro domain-containing protein n=1 Tax=Ceratocystis pirilliformis TaxID=259994 RepID=A0ABR3Z7P8_9PEZI
MQNLDYSSANTVLHISDIPTLPQLYSGGRLGTTIHPLRTPCLEYNHKVAHICADITLIEADAIVNAANCELSGGGGVDGAIHRAAGPELAAACEVLNGCKTGESKITPGFSLPARHVIHTAGPIYGRRENKESDRLLGSCYSNSLNLAVENGCKTVALCAISTGVYRFPSDSAADIATRTVRQFLEGGHGKDIDKIVFVSFEAKDADQYQKHLPKYFPPTKNDSDE